MSQGCNVSIVVPVYNERESLPHLFDELATMAGRLDGACEFLFIDDGSSDGTDEVLGELAARDRRVRVVRFRRNYGQTAAMQAGFDYARGTWIVTLDADLQNDPSDVPQMIEVARSGYDVVHGWRRHRRDKMLTRKLPSRIANWLISKTTRFPIHDLGCTLKVIHRDIARELDLYGEMHRFIPILAHWRGARCMEVVTHHRPRCYGQSKYGLSRTTRVLLDLVTVHFLLHYSARPMQWFGLLGILHAVVGLFSLVTLVAMKVGWGIDMTGNPLLLLSVLTTLLAAQFVSLGILGETLARVFFQTRGVPSYAVRAVYEADGEAKETEKSPQELQRAA